MVTGCIHKVRHIIITADTSVSCEPLLSTSRRGGYGSVAVNMTVLTDLNIVNGTVTDGVRRGSHVGEYKVPAIDPIHCGLLICSTDPVVVHRTDFLFVHQKVDHV